MLIPKETQFKDESGRVIKTGDWIMFDNKLFRVNGKYNNPILCFKGKCKNNSMPLSEAVDFAKTNYLSFLVCGFDGEKYCPQCETKRPYSEFSIDLSRRDLHSPYCRECIKMRQMGYHSIIDKRHARKAFK